MEDKAQEVLRNYLLEDLNNNTTKKGSGDTLSEDSLYIGQMSILSPAEDSNFCKTNNGLSWKQFKRTFPIIKKLVLTTMLLLALEFLSVNGFLKIDNPEAAVLYQKPKTWLRQDGPGL